MTTQHQDADLIRFLTAFAQRMGIEDRVDSKSYLLRIKARLEELTQPVPQQPDDLETIIDQYVGDYELTGDEGSYIPNERERILIMDAIMGLLADTDWDAAWGRVIDEQALARAAIARAEGEA